VTGSQPPAPDGAARRVELAAGLQAVRDRIRSGALAAGRDPADITLVVVTKTFPVSDIRLLAGLGVREVGESREQELAAKLPGCSDLDLRWHFIGRLQSNKARSVARSAHLVHSVDRGSLVTALSRAADQVGRRVDCLVQVSLDGDPHRGGVPIGQFAGLADAVAAEPGLALRGLMAVAPLGADPRVAFSALPELSDRLLRDHPQAGIVSAGMSHDLEPALACGATHLRVGSGVLGHRPPLQ
jgi:pyridoxal phosphate enzyme (YggS family)